MASKGRTVATFIEEFLADLLQANRSPETVRAYATDLGQFAAFYHGQLSRVTPSILTAFWATQSHLSPASRARKQAALSSFLGWAYRHDLIKSDPMGKITRVKREPPKPRGTDPGQVERLLQSIPRAQTRDRLLFRLVYETGMRIGEALGLYVEDLDLTADDEHVVVRGKGNSQRNVLLDNPRLVKQLRDYLKHMGYKHGPLFRATKNARGDALRYQSVHERWVNYCERAGVHCTLHQLRHTHATEMVNGGVSLATVRKRLGHKSMQTTLLYVDQSDTTADAEIRQWRRKRKS